MSRRVDDVPRAETDLSGEPPIYLEGEPPIPDDHADANGGRVAAALEDVPAARRARGRRPERYLTDLGNAERFVELHGADLRYCPAWGTWLAWDGRRFRADDREDVLRRARETARGIVTEAALERDHEQHKRLAAHGLRSEAAGRIEAMVKLARGDARVVVRPDELDADPMAFNVRNGTIDLRTGELHPHQREDLLTKLSPVDYDPDARSELWEDTIIRALGGDAGLLQYVQRAAGYWLTGDTREEVLFLWVGPTASAKSTISQSIKNTVGDYGTTTDFDTFLAHREGGPRADLARLVGRRFVLSVEVDEGRRMAEGLVKMVTGGDTITARELYGRSFEFRPTFKIVLAANVKPRVSDLDDAMWRRIHIVPFECQIPEAERDPQVKLTLTDPERSGAAILAWAVRGCLEWQRHGLRRPSAVRRATLEYREEMDPIAPFLEERCVVDRNAWVPIGDLYAAYREWAGAGGERNLLGKKALANRLEKHGFEAKRGTNGVALRHGLRLAQQETLELHEEIRAQEEVGAVGVSDVWGPM